MSGLLAFGWAITRGLQLPRSAMFGYARAVAAAGVVGIAFSSPQVYAFLHFLGESHIGPHDGDLAHAAFGWPALASSIGTPYLLGPPMGYAQGRIVVETVWGGIGGYVTAALIPVAVYGLMRLRDAIAWLLIGWCGLALGKSFGIEPAVTLMNLVPGVENTAFYRYAPPAWALAMTILAVRGLDQAAQGPAESRMPFALACIAAVAVVANAGATAASLWPQLYPVPGLRNAAAGSLTWAVLTGAIVLALLARLRAGRSLTALGFVLVVDATLMAFIPTLGNPRGGTINGAAIGFLQSNLGFQRFFTLGPIQPNYGAYYGIASINHNYLPVARAWVDWVRAHLDPGIDEVAYVGNYP
ncbi:MAG: hypothetical protein JF605_16700, partial [Burkholderia sp.]|nr:hypothetical protein [Burkholderia sp.]